MDDARNTKKINHTNNNTRGNTKARWDDDVENDTRKIGTVKWREVVQDWKTWRRITREVLTLLGQWRRRGRESQCSVDNPDLCPLHT